MNLTAPSSTVAQEIAGRLRLRAQELRDQLHAAAGASLADEAPGEVVDFKDVAAEETRAVVDEVAHAHAAGELRQIAAALRRVEQSSYGRCEDCGEAIDERRLRALPATPFCTACQQRRERPASRR